MRWRDMLKQAATRSARQTALRYETASQYTVAVHTCHDVIAQPQSTTKASLTKHTTVKLFIEDLATSQDTETACQECRT
jgi:hypothetical protein